MSDTLTSRPYQPNPAKCCEACAFGGGNHAHWCKEKRIEEMKADGRKMRTTPRCMACFAGDSNHAEWCEEKAA
jgi:hypothetical protein